MSSQINYNIIDGTYPVAGQDNSSQGFRDNFTNIKDNFEYAYNEISDLQNKALLRAPLVNGTFNNDMQGNVITNATTQGFRDQLYNISSAASGSILVDFNTGSYQTVTLAGATTISALSSFSSTAGSFARVKLQVTVNSTSSTLTLPATVTINADNLAGYDTTTRTITFDRPGIYVYEFNTIDGGSNFAVVDITNNSRNIMGGNLVITKGISNVSVTGITMTVSNVGGVAVGNITATNFIGNIISAGASASYTGNVTANYLIANSGVQGNLITSLQPNITLVGTLTSLSVSGNANVGNLTVNGISDFCGGDKVGIQFANATNTGTTTAYSNVGLVVINPTSSTIASHTLVMPTAQNGQILRVAFSNTVTALTQSGTGTDTIMGAITTGNTAGGTTWVYYKNSNINGTYGAWYRIG
jgi:hypothetical protein